MGVLERGEPSDDNETSLMEGKGIKIKTTVLHSRAAPSLCIYLPGTTPETSEEIILDPGDAVAALFKMDKTFCVCSFFSS